MKEFTTKLIRFATLQRRQSMCLAIFICLSSHFGFGQITGDHFKKLPEELGLNSTDITAIVQDTKGYIWLGTWVGLYRYDGYNARLYKMKTGDHYGLTSNKISALMVDSAGDLYIGTQLGGVIKYDYAKDRFIAFKTDVSHPLRTNVWSIFEDKQHQIWVGTEKGIGILDKVSGTVRNKDVFIKSDINSRRIQKISGCNSDYIWVASDQGVFAFFPDSDGKISLMGKFNFSIKSEFDEVSDYVSDVIQAPGGQDKIWVLCKTGIAEIDYSQGFANVPQRTIFWASKNLVFPRVIIQTSSFDNVCIVGTGDGMLLIDKSGKISDDHFLKGKLIRSIFEDRFGTIWLGTDGGLYKFNLNESFINTHLLTTDDDDRQFVEYITASPSGENIWVSWQNGSITILDGQDLRVKGNRFLELGNSIIKDKISQILIEKNGETWIATQGSGLLKTNEKALLASSVVKPIRIKESLIESYLMSIALRDKELWVGTWNTGLMRYSIATGEVIKYTTVWGLDFELLGSPIVSMDIYEDNIYLGTRGSGLIIAKIEEDNSLRLVKHLSETNPQFQLPSDFITSLSRDGSRLLICTEGGFSSYDLEKDQLINFKLDEQLPKSIIQAVVKSSDNSLWLSTYNNGILNLNEDKNKPKTKNFTKGLLANFSSNVSLQLKDGRILFGGTHGISTINTKARTINDQAPVIFFTELKINNRAVELDQYVNGSKKFTTNINELPDIKLNYNDNAFSIALNAMHTSDAQALQYAYKLQGFNDDWVYLDETEKQISFTNLPYRSYKLMFKAANSDGLWSETKILPLTISPPWWLSLPAYFVYFLCILGVIYLIVQGFVMKEQYRHQIHLEKVERAKIEEINQMKLKFYTSISHELRTPLTMIITPTEQLIKEQNFQPDVNKTHQFILKNAKKLLLMVNQLLDFRKHETEGLTLMSGRFDMVKVLAEISTGFESLAKNKNIQLSITKNCQSLPMVFDEDQVEKLFNNLYGNALKYTPSGGKINLDIRYEEKEEMVYIHVKDSGKGIHKQDKIRIFERFYQGINHDDSGYGLGLAICKNIVDLHQGEIYVESEEGFGATFIVKLPTNLKPTHHSKDLEHTQLFGSLDDNNEVEHDSKQSDLGIPTMLIVEDNEEIREYIRLSFVDEFRILEASNGVTGLALCQENIPDIVISDIAMPEKDGIELTREIKSNMATSHIPVILLTARTSVEYKLSGYDAGANAYVTKPFNLELLKHQVSNLLQYNRLLKDKYDVGPKMQQYTYEPEKPMEQSLDEEFMQQLTRTIEENMAEADFTVDDMAKLLLMSRIQVYRKVKALTGQTPNNFLRDVRLKRAAQLLELTDYSIQEVTYKVGFNDLKYFREKFRDEFGVNPSEYRQVHKTINHN